LQEGFKKMCMMTSLCHGTLASASALALQGVALALAWPWECSDGLGLGVCGLVNIPEVLTHDISKPERDNHCKA